MSYTIHKIKCKSKNIFNNTLSNKFWMRLLIKNKKKKKEKQKTKK